ncbi:hypothetical protein OF83DRAFT_1162019 [Amylostereum chailletii]|nr:hypothetical protein OF83DRAFT_1162019 [Amylostereum chailletii]
MQFTSLLAIVALAASVACAPTTSQDSRLIQFRPTSGEIKTEWISSSALASIQSDNFDRSASELSGVSDELIESVRGARRGPGFLDITDFQDKASTASAQRQAYPTPDPSKHTVLKDKFFGQVSAAKLRSTVDSLSNNFTTRAYRGKNARAPALWIQTQFAAAAGSANVQLIENSFDQPNVVAKIPGSSSKDIVIVGAHLDSTAGSSARAPGADDGRHGRLIDEHVADASGIAVILQALQILKSNGYTGSKTIEFHAYAGEEGGLLGSQTVANKYKSDGASVIAMLQMDMVAYQDRDKPSLTVLTDTDSTLVKWTHQLISTYLPNDYLEENSCGYACTDHFSWEDEGYPGVSVDESGPDDAHFNPYYHSPQDTLDKLDFDKSTEFVKMVLAFVVELAQ